MTAAWHDTTGTGQLVTSWYQSDESTDIFTAISQATSPVPNGLWATTLVVAGGSSLPGSVPVQNCARILYVTSNGTRVPLLIPGAQSGVYLSDGETVNPNSPLVQAVTAAFLSKGRSAASEGINSYLSGTKLVVRLPNITH